MFKRKSIKRLIMAFAFFIVSITSFFVSKGQAGRYENTHETARDIRPDTYRATKNYDNPYTYNGTLRIFNLSPGSRYSETKQMNNAPFPNYMINGETYFCIEPNNPTVIADGSRDHNPGEKLIVPYKEKDINEAFQDAVPAIGQVKAILRYGYYYPGHQTLEYRVATQALIWQKGSADSRVENMVISGPNVEGVNRAIAEIERLILNDEDLVGFRKVDNFKVGEEKELNETSGKFFERFEQPQDNEYFSFRREGDRLFATAKRSTEGQRQPLVESRPNKKGYNTRLNSLYQGLVDRGPARVFGAEQGQPSSQLFIGGGSSFDPDFPTLFARVDYDPTGNIKVSKKDADLNANKSQGGANLTETQFEIVNKTGRTVRYKQADGNFREGIANNEVVDTITLNADNTSDNILNRLEPGDYEIRESRFGTGYKEETNVRTVTIRENNVDEQLLDFTNNVMKGSFTFTKKDRDLNMNQGQGDAKNLTASFKVVNKNQNSIMYNGTEVQPDQDIFTFTTSEEGTYTAVANILPYGLYDIVETVAPVGYQLNNTPTRVNINGDNVVITSEMADDVNTNRFKLTKFLNVNGGAASLEKEENAEFIVMLKSWIKDNYNGDAKEAAKAIKLAYKGNRNQALADLNLTEKEWDVVRTDTEGTVWSKDLAFGTYVLVQTEAAHEDILMTEEVTEFVVSEHQSEPKKEFFYANQLMDYYVKLIKVEEETGEKVTFSSAKFKIRKQGETEFIKQRVGNKVYDTFMTKSETGKAGSKIYVDTEGENGEVTVPLKLQFGTYELVEVESPWGFYKSEEPILLDIRKASITERDENNEPIIAKGISNKRLYGKLAVTKRVKENVSDRSFINRNDLSGIKFGIFAKEPVYSPVTGAKLFEADQEVVSKYLQANGTFEEVKLPLGKYYYKELEAPAGYVLKDEKVDFEIKQTPENEVKDELITITSEFENDTTLVSFSKQDVGGKEIKGAKISIVKKETGEEVYKYTSKEEPTIVEGLERDTVYVMKEDTAPLGFVKSTEVEFTVNNTNEKQNVKMIDHVNYVTKVDNEGNIVKGAVIEVLEGDNIIERFTTGEKLIDLTDEEKGKLMNGEEVTKENKKLIPIRKQKSGILAGILGTQETVSITIVEDVDGNTKYSEVNMDGVEEKHRLSGLEEGKTYVIREAEAPEGFYYAEDTVVNVIDTDSEIKVVDNKINVEIVKVDDSNVPLVDAKMELYEINKEDKTETKIHEWETVKEPENVSSLVKPGGSYRVVETEAPAGYYISVSKNFDIPKYGTSETVTVTMVDVEADVNFEVVKTNCQKGKRVRGGEYSITNKKGKEITRFTVDEDLVSRDNEGREISKLLKEGERYFIKQTKTPFGFHKDEKTYEFEMTGNKNNKQVIRMDAIAKKIKVKVVKRETDNEATPVAGAEFKVFDENGDVRRGLHGEELIKLTDENGKAEFELCYRQDGEVWIKETKAPIGYILEDEARRVEPKEDADFENYEIKVLNRRIAVVRTAIENSTKIAGIVLATSAVAGGTAYYFIRRNKRNK